MAELVMVDVIVTEPRVLHVQDGAADMLSFNSCGNQDFRCPLITYLEWACWAVYVLHLLYMHTFRASKGTVLESGLSSCMKAPGNY